MLSRIAGRVITGPFAFLLAGVIDIAAFVVSTWRVKLRGGAGRRLS